MHVFVCLSESFTVCCGFMKPAVTLMGMGKTSPCGVSLLSSPLLFPHLVVYFNTNVYLFRFIGYVLKKKSDNCCLVGAGTMAKSYLVSPI